MISLIVDHLLESTLFAMLMGLLTLCFATNRAGVRYGLWFAASLKFLIPFSLIVATGNALRWETAPAVALDLKWSVAEAASDLRLPEVLADMAAPPAATPAAGAYTASGGMDLGPGLESVLLALWLGGIAVLLCLWTLQWILLLRVRRASLPSGIPAAIPVRLSVTLLEPGLVGIFRPVLLLPEGITAQLSPAQLGFVIEHELCHWRRRDNLTAALHMAVELVFWFHPLVWWIGARLVAERERACDESVLAAGGDPKAYAYSILEVCRFYVHSPLPCASGIAGANLKHRVKWIMDNGTFTRLSRAKLVLLAGTAASALLLPMAWGLLTPAAAAAQPLPNISPLPTQALYRAALYPLVSMPTQLDQPARETAPPAVQVAARAPTAAAPRIEQVALLPAQNPQPQEEKPQAEKMMAANAPAPAATPAPVPPTAPPPAVDEIVVTGKAIRDFVRTSNFVRLYTAPSDFLDQIARWHAPLCVHTAGLAPAYNAFVTARVKDVAAQIGAPQAQSEPCKTNLDIVFTPHPQELLDYIRTKRPELLGPHYPALRKKLATVSHPVQAWYATGTRDYHGRWEIDSYDEWGNTVDGSPPVYTVPGSHLRTGLSSEFASVVVVADAAKVGDWEIGTIADYVAMMAFSRMKTLDKCQQVPSIANVFGDCSDGVRAKALSDFDMAYLRALYLTASDAPRGLQESGISRAMLKILEKEIAEKKGAGKRGS